MKINNICTLTSSEFIGFNMLSSSEIYQLVVISYGERYGKLTLFGHSTYCAKCNDHIKKHFDVVGFEGYDRMRVPNIVENRHRSMCPVCLRKFLQKWVNFKNIRKNDRIIKKSTTDTRLTCVSTIIASYM